MTLQVSCATSGLFQCRRSFATRAFASENLKTLERGAEEKVKLGGSDVKVTRLGIGAWSWGDTTYWNDFQWDGALTGKYTPENPPTGPRGRIYTTEFLRKLQPLVSRIKEIGRSYGKTPTQVVLNWLIAQKNVVPIPGAKNAEQAREFVGALGWRLTDQEVEELRAVASQTKSVIGFPVEKL